MIWSIVDAKLTNLRRLDTVLLLPSPVTVVWVSTNFRQFYCPLRLLRGSSALSAFFVTRPLRLRLPWLALSASSVACQFYCPLRLLRESSAPSASSIACLLSVPCSLRLRLLWLAPSASFMACSLRLRLPWLAPSASSVAHWLSVPRLLCLRPLHLHPLWLVCCLCLVRSVCVCSVCVLCGLSAICASSAPFASAPSASSVARLLSMPRPLRLRLLCLYLRFFLVVPALLVYLFIFTL